MIKRFFFDRVDVGGNDIGINQRMENTASILSHTADS
jgi:hypothetical protein